MSQFTLRKILLRPSALVWGPGQSASHLINSSPIPISPLTPSLADIPPRLEIDDVLPARCWVPFDVVLSLRLAEDDPGGRQALGKLAASPLLDPVDFDVAEMRLAAGIGVQIVYTPLETLSPAKFCGAHAVGEPSISRGEMSPLKHVFCTRYQRFASGCLQWSGCD